MFRPENLTLAFRCVLLFVCLSSSWQPATVRAQSDEELRAWKQKVSELTREQKYTEALPLLEKLAVAEPDNANTQFYLGFALLAQGNITKDAATRKALRVRARNVFIRARDLGVTEPVVHAM